MSNAVMDNKQKRKLIRNTEIKINNPGGVRTGAKCAIIGQRAKAAIS